MNENYQKIAHYMLHILSVAGSVNFHIHIEATPTKLIVIPVSPEGKPLELGLNLVHVSTLRRVLEEMVVVPNGKSYQLEITYEEIASIYEVNNDVVRDSK